MLCTYSPFSCPIGLISSSIPLRAALVSVCLCRALPQGLPHSGRTRSACSHCLCLLLPHLCSAYNRHLSHPVPHTLSPLPLHQCQLSRAASLSNFGHPGQHACAPRAQPCLAAHPEVRHEHFLPSQFLRLFGTSPPSCTPTVRGPRFFHFIVRRRRLIARPSHVQLH